jgi:putative transposon-encoded protein
MNEVVISKWQQVERINFGRVIPADLESLMHFVEEPLQEAVGIMFEKNVPTIGSSCNINDYVQGRAWISADYDFMSSRNQQIVRSYKYSEYSPIFNRKLGHLVTVVGLFLPIEPHEFPKDIGTKAIKLAEKFDSQPNSLPKNI